MKLKNVFILFFLLAIILLSVLAVQAILMFQNQKELERNQEIRFKSYSIAEELKQSSEDLTRYCRTYVARGDSVWENKYWEVLDIRDGKKPRPDGRTIALLDSMKKLGFSKAEFDKLREAEQNSNDLVWTEKIAFNAVKGLFADRNKRFTIKRTPDKEMAIRIMFDDKYLSDKARIMKSIDDFFVLLDKRTAHNLEKHNSTGYWLLSKIIILIFSIALISIIFFFIIKRKIINQIEKLQQANLALKEEKELFQLFMDNIPGLAYIKNHDTRVLFSNQGFKSYLNIDPAAIINKSAHEIFPSEFADLIESDDLNVLKSGNKKVIEEQFGEKVWSTYKFVIPRIDGLPLLGGITLDITERKKTEEALKKLYLAVEQSPVTIVITDPTGVIEYVNPKFTQISGYTVEEAKGKNPRILKPDNSSHEKYNDLWRTISSGNVWKGELCNRKKNGELFWEDASISPIFDSNGAITNYIAIKEDISTKKQIENSLHYERTLLRTLIDNVPDLIYCKDAEARKTLANKADVRLMGLKSEAEALGKDDTAFYPYDRAKEFIAEDMKVINSGEPAINTEGFHLDDQGRKRWYITGKYPLRDSDGKIIGLAGIGRDITERKLVEEALVQSEIHLRELNASKDKFFSIIAHDLKSPFNVILGFSKILSTEFDTLTDEEKFSFIKAINETSYNTFKLLENLLEWSRLQTGKMILQKEKINVLLELHPTLTLLKQVAENKQIAFVNAIDNSIEAIADKYMLATIIRNLISNAIKFSNPGGRIVIDAKKCDSSIEFSVSDTGVGINKENLEKLFQIDRSISTRGTANEKGTGLGLLLCKEMVEKHGGEMHVESEEGVGTTFFFKIPVS